MARANKGFKGNLKGGFKGGSKGNFQVGKDKGGPKVVVSIA